MDTEPPKWWHKLRLKILARLPLEPRKKIRKIIQLGDEYQRRGEGQLAELCYHVSKQLADEAGTVHLRKKIEQRL